MTATVASLIQDRRILVVCGAGGGGKTTTATGIALAAARSGRRVLALTVDPSRRLAQTLGVDRNLKEPVSISVERLAQAGIEPPGSLETWMLDPKLVSDRLVAKLARTPEERDRLMNNRIYRGISKMIAGMQEYMAMEALHQFHSEGRYDLVVLDTPPSRNALAFLDGPRRMSNFLDGRIFSLFVPSEDASVVRKAARKLLDRVNSIIFGEETYSDLQEFFGSFANILGVLNVNAGKMLKMLADEEQVAFLLVTSPTSASVDDVKDFRDRTVQMDLPCAGFILNRSQALSGHRVYPELDMLTGSPSDAAMSGMTKLQQLARLEMAEMERDQELLGALREEAGGEHFAVALPTVPGGANDMESLLDISRALMQN